MSSPQNELCAAGLWYGRGGMVGFRGVVVVGAMCYVFGYLFSEIPIFISDAQCVVMCVVKVSRFLPPQGELRVGA